MIVLTWLAFLLIGKIVIYAWMAFHFPKFAKKFEWLVELHNCDFCSGCYVYTLLSIFMNVNLLTAFGFDYVPWVSQIITGIVVSFLVHIFTLGWKAKYDVVVV